MTFLRGAAIALVLLLLPGRADAFCRTTTAAVPANYDPSKNGCITSGLVLYWRGQCVTYAVNENAAGTIGFADATRVIDEAFATWTSAVCPSSNEKLGLSVTDLGAVTCDEVRYNPGSPNQNLIVFRQDKWPYNDSSNTLGLTTITFNAENGEIFDADMEINATGKNLTITDDVPANGFDLLSVVTHEAGHFMGLAHATSPTATMFASYKPGTKNLRTLTADDIAGVCAIYPDVNTRVVDKSVAATGGLSADACSAEPRHGFTKKCDEPVEDDKGCATAPSAEPKASLAWGWLGALGIGLVAARRRRSM